jgi:predicted lipoprotein with Yx(FWY)xxD motif
MRLSAMPARKRSLLSFALLALALVAMIGPAGAVAGRTKVVAKKMQNASLGKVILTNTKGHALYSLSVERHGKFTCTGGCLSIWHPLVVRPGVKPIGPVKFATVKRPDGRMQVTYKGLPLYSFTTDTKAGETNGEGLKDVGTWHVAAIGKIPQSQPAPERPLYPY